MKKGFIIAAAVVLCCAVIITAVCVINSGDREQYSEPTAEILYSAAGMMPSLLSSKTVDAYMIWQPFVAVGEKSGIGKVISYSRDLPPKGKWYDHTCCVFGTNSYGIENEEITESLVAMLMLATDFINENPDKSAQACADWLFAMKDMKYGDITVNSLVVSKASNPTIKFTTDVTDKWISSNLEFVQTQRELGLIKSKLCSTTDDETKKIVFDFTAYNAAKSQINSGRLNTPNAVKKISIGYLPDDHDTALFVLVKEWKYFKERYNCYIKPENDKLGKPTSGELYINGKKIADLEFVEGSAGPYLMTLMQQNAIQYAIAGAPPYLSAIDKSSGNAVLKILCPIMTEGSGLVASIDSPASDWNSFVEWVKERSASGNNVVIATPQLGAIQDVQIKSALKSAGINYVIKSA